MEPVVSACLDLAGQLEQPDEPGRIATPTVTASLRASLRQRLVPGGRCSDATDRGLADLLVGRLVLTPRQLPEGRFFAYADTATYGALLTGAVAGLVPPG